MTRSALERSSLHRGWTRDLCGRDFRWWLLRQIELEATEKEFQVRFGLGVAGQEQLAAIAGGDLDVDHMDRGEFLEGAMRCQTGGEAVQTREHQKPWGSSGCGSQWGGLDIVGGHGRIQGGEQVMERAIEGSCSRL